MALTAAVNQCFANGFVNAPSANITNTPIFKITDIVAFGASYMSNGANGGVPMQPASAFEPPGGAAFAGRASNGPTFVEILSGSAISTADPTQGLFPNSPALAGGTTGPCVGPLNNANLHNFAVSGATCDSRIFNQQPTVASVIQQVQNFMASPAAANLNPATTLYLFLPTTSDITGLGNIGANPDLAQKIAACYQNQMTALITANNAQHFLFGNAYPNNLAPESTARQGLPAVRAAQIQNLNGFLDLVPAAINASLMQQYAGAAASPQVSIHYLDINGLFNFLITNSLPFFGPTADVTNPCMANGVLTPACAANPGSFLWWDGHHPTARTHGMIAQMINQILSLPQQWR